MLLTIDVGNTNTVFAVFRGSDCVLESRVETNSARMADQYAVMLDGVLRLHNVNRSDISGAIVSSVVPPVIKQVREAVKRLTAHKVLVIGPGIKTGLNIKIDNPAELGSDLVCGAVAAKSFYSAPCIVIDLGTATKLSALNKYGDLTGVVLATGVGVGFKAMSETTAALPLVGIEMPQKAIGTNTTDSIRSGIIYGTACMLDGLIERMEAEIGETCSVVATGGFSEVIVPYCKREIEVNRSLVAHGLRIIYEKNVV